MWNKTKEGMDPEARCDLQGARLQKLVERLYHNVPFYRQKLQELDILPSDIRSIDDITKLPFTTKKDMRDNYPCGLFAVPKTEIIRIHASSGTTGKPTIVGYTRKDLAVWSECIARSLYAWGVRNTDIVSVAYGYGLFTGGLGFHDGAQHLGATVLPTSTGNTEKHIRLLRDLQVTVLACTPSYALHLYETIKKMGYSMDEFALRIGCFGGEPWTESMRREIETNMGIKGYNMYGLSEIMGPGVAYECECQKGSHFNEDHFYPEIIDPQTLEVLPDGEKGELVITTLTKEGIPLIRYRTRDLTALHHGTCACGRTEVRIDPIMGRSDDMLIIRGINVFPSQIESVILDLNAFEPQYQLIVDRKDNLDTLDVLVEVKEGYYSDNLADMVGLKKELHDKLKSVLSINANVQLVEPGSIERSQGKSNRVVDKRILK